MSLNINQLIFQHRMLSLFRPIIDLPAIQIRTAFESPRGYGVLWLEKMHCWCAFSAAQTVSLYQQREVCVVEAFLLYHFQKLDYTVMQALFMSLSLSNSEIGLAHTLPRGKRFVPEKTVVSRVFCLCKLSVASI